MLPGEGLKIKLLVLLAVVFLLSGCITENAGPNTEEKLAKSAAANLPLEEATAAEEVTLPPTGEITTPSAEEKTALPAEERVNLDSEAKVVEQLNKILAE